GLNHFPPLLLTALRFAVAALPVFFVPRPDLGAARLVAVGLFLFVGQFVFLFSGMAAGLPAGLASIA
ncbi:O-acetylserine/cysteine exporter, partial [Pseudomonas aeruginosa]